MTSVLVIGTGSIGERHLRCFQTTGRATVAACEPNATLREKITSQYACPGFASLEEALAAQRWDAAVICTPAHTHIPIARTCVAAGMHVLIEKPLAVSLDGITELAAAAAARQAIVRVAYVHRSITAIVKTREIIQSGQLGAVRHVVMTAGQDFPLCRPAYASTYFAQRSSGGGCIQDAITHCLHAVEWLVAPIESVFCDASHQALATPEVEDTVNLIARLRGGIPACFVQNQFQTPTEVTFSFYGLDGSVRAELHNQRIGLCPRGETTWTWTDLPKEERDAMFIRQAEGFLDALTGKPDSLSTLEDGLQTLKVNLAALQSSDTRSEVIL